MENEEKEITINITLGQLNNKGLWEEFCDYKGWDYYRSSDLCDWDETVTVPLSKAKEWRII